MMLIRHRRRALGDDGWTSFQSEDFFLLGRVEALGATRRCSKNGHAT